MQLFYEGVDIAGKVDVVKCIHRDGCGGRCDCLELELEHAGAWYSWEPKQGDRIVAARDGYDTGTLYLNTILPQEGRFRILATSVPVTARRKRWASYEENTLGGILTLCAAECGMSGSLYGLNGSIMYPYLLRRDESGAAFANRLLEMEGAVLKTVNGKFAGIGVEYAQGLAAVQELAIGADQRSVIHMRRDDQMLYSLTVKTPYGECTAYAPGAAGCGEEVLAHLPAMDDAQAGRWARNLLLMRNRRAEELTFSMEFNPGLSAMVRVDVQSATDAAGEWIVDETEHDFVRGISKAKLLRCLTDVR